MPDFEEAVQKSYEKLNKTQSKETEEKDNSMFGREILKELGIDQDIIKEEQEEILI